MLKSLGRKSSLQERKTAFTKLGISSCHKAQDVGLCLVHAGYEETLVNCRQTWNICCYDDMQMSRKTFYEAVVELGQLPDMEASDELRNQVAFNCAFQ